jgi:hypothetical protein
MSLMNTENAAQQFFDSEASRKFDEQLAKLLSHMTVDNGCPDCGSTLETKASFHCSGRDEQGNRWKGSGEVVKCLNCHKWFRLGRGPNNPPPWSWQPCEPLEFGTEAPEVNGENDIE